VGGGGGGGFGFIFVVISSEDCYTNRTKAVADASIISFMRLTRSMAVTVPFSRNHA